MLFFQGARMPFLGAAQAGPQPDVSHPHLHCKESCQRWRIRQIQEEHPAWPAMEIVSCGGPGVVFNSSWSVKSAKYRTCILIPAKLLPQIFSSAYLAAALAARPETANNGGAGIHLSATCHTCHSHLHRNVFCLGDRDACSCSRVGWQSLLLL